MGDSKRLHRRSRLDAIGTDQLGMVSSEDAWSVLEDSQSRFTTDWISARNRAESAATSSLAIAQSSFDQQVAAVEAMGLDAQARAIRVEEIREVENRRLDNRRAQIERDKLNAIGRAEAEMNQQRSALQDRTKAFTLALTPLPAILVGFLVFSRKKKRRAPGGAA